MYDVSVTTSPEESFYMQLKHIKLPQFLFDKEQNRTSAMQ